MLLAVCRSVVTLGAVHVSSTRSPLRAPRRSAGGFGSCSDGGCGGAIVAHAVNITGAAKTKSVEAERLMRKKPDYQTSLRGQLPHRLAKHFRMPVHILRLSLRAHQRHIVKWS